MNNLLASLLQIIVPLFAVTSMLAVGLGFSMRQILEPLRNKRGVLRSIATNFVWVPLLAFGITQALALERAPAIGLILIGSAAGAPFLVKLTTVARGDVAFSATLLVLLLVVTIIYMPLVVPRVLPDARVNAFEIAKSLGLTMLVPLAIGHSLEAKARGLASRLAPLMAKLSSFSLVALIVATFILYLPSILSIRPVALLAAGLLIGGAFLSGFFLINRASPRRSVLGFGTAQRNIAAATVVAQTFDDSGVLVMVVVTSLIDLAVLFPIAWVLRYRGQRKPPDQIQLRRTA